MNPSTIQNHPASLPHHHHPPTLAVVWAVTSVPVILTWVQWGWSMMSAMTCRNTWSRSTSLTKLSSSFLYTRWAKSEHLFHDSFKPILSAYIDHSNFQHQILLIGNVLSWSFNIVIYFVLSCLIFFVNDSQKHIIECWITRM